MRGAVVGALLSIRVATAPSPTSRPRFVRVGNFVRTYFAESYQTFVAACQKQFSHHADTFPAGGLPLAARVEIIGSRPKTTKLSSPRGDVDNHVKGVLDAATKSGLWSDDGRVECLIATKRWASPDEEEGVLLEVGELTEDALEELRGYSAPVKNKARKRKED